MTYENRIYVAWDEAAEILGTDREGLRQLMLYRFSPDDPGEDKYWLQIMLSAPGDGFMTSLRHDWDYVPSLSWSGRESFYVNTLGVSTMSFPDGKSFPLEGRDGEDYWYATHGYGSGYSRCFALGGSTLVIQPCSVRQACEDGGRLDGTYVLPRNWCVGGQPRFWFAIVNCENYIYRRRPEDIYKSAQFLRNQVEEAKQFLEQNPGAERKERSANRARVGEALKARERNNLLRIIRALDAMNPTPLPARGYAESIKAQIETLGLAVPSDDTIRKAIEDARGLDS